MTIKMQPIELLLNDARGIYIPRDFVEGFELEAWNLDPESLMVRDCQNPEGEHYWDAWEDILNKAEYFHDGNVWTLWQDGDLWAVCWELMTDEEKANFGFEE